MNNRRKIAALLIGGSFLLAGCRTIHIEEGLPGDPGLPGEPGLPGDKGSDAKTPYEEYIALHPEYSGDEEQWYEDMASGALADGAQGSDGLTYYIFGNECSVIGYLGSDKDVAIPEYYLGKKVVSIGNKAFNGNLVIESVAISRSVKAIRCEAFNGATNLKTVSFSEGLESIDTYAFQKCSSLTSIALPDSLVEMGHAAFARCSSLEEISLGASLSSLAPYVFEGCAFRKIEIPSSVKAIESDAFKNCASLSEVKFSEGLERISSVAFEGCPSLAREFVLPSSLKTIRRNIFGYLNGATRLNSISAIHIPSGVETIYAEALALIDASSAGVSAEDLPDYFIASAEKGECWSSSWAGSALDYGCSKFHWGVA